MELLYSGTTVLWDADGLWEDDGDDLAPSSRPRRGKVAEEVFAAAVGRRIRTIRRARGLTQQRCAAALGISFQQLQKYENGRNRIAASTLVLLAEVLEVAPSALLDDTTDPMTVPPRRRTPERSEPDLPRIEAVSHPLARRAIADLIRALTDPDAPAHPDKSHREKDGDGNENGDGDGDGPGER